MQIAEFLERKKTVRLPQGEVAYADIGEGPVALFIHGVFMNSLLWRNAIAELGPNRRFVAIDLPGHGGTTAKVEGRGVSLIALAELVRDFLDELGIDKVDLVGNDTGGAVCQVFAVRFPERIRTLTLTNCDVHTNFPPEEFAYAFDLAREGQMAPLLAQVAGDIELARTDAGMAVGYQDLNYITPELVDAYLGRFKDPSAGRELEERMSGGADQLLSDFTDELKRFEAPTLVVWGTNDKFFSLDWAYWLKDNVPGVTDVVEIEGGKLFFVDERGGELAPHLEKHWSAHSS